MNIIKAKRLRARMNRHVKEIFSDCSYFLKRFDDENYKYNMELFRKKWNGTFVDTILANNYDADSASFVSQVKVLYTRFGKLKQSRRQELGLFMIYYVFPAIILTECENAGSLCDVLLASWNKEMETDITYMNYEEILATFNDKLLGMLQ